MGQRSYFPTYFSLEDIIVTQEKIPCETVYNFKSLGLKTHFQSKDNAKQNSVEIPLWLALMIMENLETENIFQLKMPKLFKNINTDMVETNACAFNLFRINEHFYEYGIYLCLLDLKGNEFIEYIIDKTFCARLEMLLDWARSGLPEPNKIQCLDTTEQMLLKCSNKARIRYDKWLEKGSSRIIQDEHFDDIETMDNIVLSNHSENFILPRKEIEGEEDDDADDDNDIQDVN